MNRYVIFVSFILLFLHGIQACSGVANEQKLENERGIGVVQIPIAGKQSLNLYAASYALLIGESRYASWPSLESIPEELEQVKAVLQSQGFQVTQKMNLDSVQLKQAFEDFINQYGFEPNNRLLFFFSGHGYTRKNGNKGYIVPIDAPLPEKAEWEFVQKAVDMELVTTWARKIETKHALFLFDSCFSGTVFKARNLPEIPKYIDKVVAKPVRQFITAGSADEVVPAKSVFTPAFVDGLRESKADINHDGFVTGDELGVYLAGEVPKYTQQTPQFGKIKEYDLAQGNFVFALGDEREEPEPVIPNVQYPFDKLIYRVKKQLGLDSDDLAEKFIVYVQDAVEQVQENFSKIASHETSKDEKNTLIDQTINKYFVNSFATVQVATLENPKIKEFSVDAYLKRLSKLSETGYDTVTFLFDKDYLHMGQIERYGLAYEFEVDMWQMFEGCKKGLQPCYKAYTERGLHFSFEPVNNSWQLKIKSVTTHQPIPFREGLWR